MCNILDKYIFNLHLFRLPKLPLRYFSRVIKTPPTEIISKLKFKALSIYENSAAVFAMYLAVFHGDLTLDPTYLSNDLYHFIWKL